MGSRYTYGVYLIIEDNKVIYIGIDKHIDNDLRLKQHLEIGNYSKQPINTYIQSCKEENWKYKILVDKISRKTAKRIERNYIKHMYPLYNIVGRISGQKD